MLVLSRNVVEKVMVGDDVVVTILGVEGDRVKVGVTAPKDRGVHREEIYKRIQKEKQRSGS